MSDPDYNEDEKMREKGHDRVLMTAKKEEKAEEKAEE